jgi:hypothetical protein
MTPFEAFKMFLAMKTHFTQPSFDYIKYNGQVKVPFESFERRRDKYHFAKLANMKDLQGHLIANFADREVSWVGDLLTEEAAEVYLKWQGRNQTLSYRFKEDLSLLRDDFKGMLTATKGNYPRLLVLFKRGKISIETMVILNNLLTFIPYWDKIIIENVIWPSTRLRLLKYASFVHYDRAKLKPLIIELMKGEPA